MAKTWYQTFKQLSRSDTKVGKANVTEAEKHLSMGQEKIASFADIADQLATLE